MTARAKLAAILEERLALMAPSRRLRLALAEVALTARQPQRSLRVLDAGCGDGLLTLALAKRHPHWTVIGADIDPNLLAGARERARARSLDNVEFEATDLTGELPWGGFDAVFALECLTEIPDDEAALDSMANSLSPGGLLITQVPSKTWRPVLPGSAATWRAEVRHGYDASDLERALRGAGLDRVEIEPTYYSATMAAQEIRDRIKGSSLPIRLLAFPLMVAAVRLERWGLRPGHANALLASARRPSQAGGQ